jgi:hypothetical protein
VTSAALGLLAALALSGPAANDEPAWLPADGFQGAWTRSGPFRVFSGTQLYDHIDGGAEAFLELGFESVRVQKYRAADDDEIGVELYQLTDPVAALGIYLARCGPETPAPGLADRHTAGRHQLLLVRGRYFLVVDNLSGKAERAGDLVGFAHAIAAKLPAEHGDDRLDSLPLPDRVLGSERVIRGALGLQAFVLLGEGDVLQLNGRVTAVAARYDGGQDGPHGLVRAPYPDAATAERAFLHLAGNLDRELHVIERGDARLVLRDHAGRFVIASRCDARIQLVFGLERRPTAPRSPACSDSPGGS